jgi:hypothetical protein
MNLNFFDVYDKQRLFSVATEVQIYEHCLKEKLKLGDWYCSVVRPPGVVDNNPSLTFTISNNKIYWKDWGYGLQGDVIDFIKAFYREQTMTFAIKKFLSEFSNSKDMTTAIEKERAKRLVTYTTKPYEQKELSYWKQADVDLTALMLYNTALVDKVFDAETGDLLFYSSSQSPIFVAEKLGLSEKSFQLYRPFETIRGRKFRNQFQDSHILFGLHQLIDNKDFKTKACIITKSNKDMITINSAGIDSIGITSESILISNIHIKYLCEKYGMDNIYTWFDNDEAGIKLAAKYKRIYGCKPIFVPHKFADKAKDPFSFAVHYNEEFEKHLVNLH